MPRLIRSLSILSTLIVMVSCSSEQKASRETLTGNAVTQGDAASGAPISSPQAPYFPPEAPNADKETLNKGQLNWLDIGSRPLSTVSIDVDTAAYSRARSQIKNGLEPVPESVRAEEFLNYFPYAYEGPTDDRILRVHQQLVASPWTPGAQILALGLKAKDLGLVDPPRNLVFLVDVSGSMASEDKLPLVKASLVKLTDTLRPEDRIAVVTYAGYTEVALPSTAGSEKDLIKQAIQRLGAGGGTNGGSGLTLAYDIAQKQFQSQAVNRVILTTDGDFNVGVVDIPALVQIIRQKNEAGIFLTILGFGINGNDSLMEDVAKDGNGNYFFIDSTREIDKVFGSDLKSNIVTLAKDVKVQIEFNPRLIKSYRLIGYADRQLNDDEFNKDEKDAGDLGSAQSVTYLYEVMPRPADEAFVGTYEPANGVEPLLYQTAGALTPAADRQEIGTIKVRYKTPEAALSTKLDEPLSNTLVPAPSIDLQWQLAVAETAILLGKIRGLQTSYAIARERAAAALGPDSLGLRQEFLELLDRMLTRPK